MQNRQTPLEIEPLEILYQDEYLVVINKPSGLLVHKSPIDKNETRFALQELRNQIGQYVYPMHRLDKPTSGVLLFGLNKEVAQIISESFRKNEIYKEYIAVVRGYTQKSGIISHPLKQMLDTKVEKEVGITQEEKDAVTRYECLATVELSYPVSRYPTARYSLVRLQPKTGRKHQLRRHMKHIHHHIIGDTTHGRGEHNQLFRKKFDCYRLLLHANRIKFMHPVIKKSLDIYAGYDTTFQKILYTFGRDSVK